MKRLVTFNVALVKTFDFDSVEETISRVSRVTFIITLRAKVL